MRIRSLPKWVFADIADTDTADICNRYIGADTNKQMFSLFLSKKKRKS